MQAHKHGKCDLHSYLSHQKTEQYTLFSSYKV